VVAVVGPAVLRLVSTPGERERFRCTTTQRLGARRGALEARAVMELQTLSVGEGGAARRRARLLRLELRGGYPFGVRPALLRALGGAAVEFTQDPRGALGDWAPWAVPEAQEPVRDAVLGALQGLQPRLPEAPVSPGATWADTAAVSLRPGEGASLTLMVETTWRLEALRGTAAGALVEARISFVQRLQAAEGATMASFPVTGGGEARGELVLDLSRGRLERAQVTGSLGLRLGLPTRTVESTSRFAQDLQRVP
jgi:hypothetical protein